MIGKEDLSRIVAEIVANFETNAEPGEPVEAWIEQHDISKEAFEYLVDAVKTLWMRSMSDLNPDTCTPAEFIDAALLNTSASALMLFCIGWESCTQYAKRT